MSTRQQTWFGQPRGLTILFLTEMWEQFSYYGMRALLVYYMTKQLLIGQPAETFHSTFRSTFLLLFAVGLAVTVFRGAYEQVGNTVALWADAGINRAVSATSIPMTWFQALNPLLVIVMTPMLLARWRRRADAGHVDSSMKKMALGAETLALSTLQSELA